MRQIIFPKITERIVALTLPEKDEMFICDHDEVYDLNLNKKQFKVTGINPNEFIKKNITYGLGDGLPIISINGMSINHNFIEHCKEVRLELFNNGTGHVIIFPILSGDWFFVSFSKCGKYLVMAEPYDFRLYSLCE